MQLCGHDTVDSSENESTMQDSTETLKLNGDLETSLTTIGSSTDQSDQRLHQHPMTLYQEFSLLNKNIPNVTIDLEKVSIAP